MKIINEEIQEEIIDGEMILYNPKKQVIVTLNITSTRIWRLLKLKNEKKIEDEFLKIYKFKTIEEKENAINQLKYVLTKLETAGCIEEKE